jgi:hypothetical protein
MTATERRGAVCSSSVASVVLLLVLVTYLQVRDDSTEIAVRGSEANE